MTQLVYRRTRPVIGPVVRALLYLFGIDIPRQVSIGPGLDLRHPTAGVVVHPHVEIGANVTLFHNVTIGRARPWTEYRYTGTPLVHIADGAIISAGAVVLGTEGELLSVGTGTIVAANAVLTQSTGAGEVWAGNPARKAHSRRA